MGFFTCQLFACTMDERASIPGWLAESEKFLEFSVSAFSVVRMPNARYGHISAFYNDSLFIFGGRIIHFPPDRPGEDNISRKKKRKQVDRNPRMAAKDSWMYNMTTHQWKVLEYNEAYYLPRVYASSFLSEGKLHIVGGRADFDNGNRIVQEIPERIDIFNFVTMQWEKPRRFNISSSYFPAVLGTGNVMKTSENTSDSLLILLGGYKSDALTSPSSRELKRYNTKTNSLTSTITRKYGYYAFHPQNFTQFHIFSSFDALPVFGHQTLNGPGHSLLLIGGYQREIESRESAEEFERMMASDRVYVLRPNITCINRQEDRWHTWSPPSLRCPRAHFSAARITADVEGGVGKETTDVLFVYGGTNDSNTNDEIDSVEFLDLGNGGEKWYSLPVGKNFTSPSHSSIAHCTERNYVRAGVFRPIHRIAISGGVSKRSGYHSEILLFDIMLGQRRETFKSSQISEIIVNSIRIKRVLSFLILCVSLLAMGQRFGIGYNFFQSRQGLVAETTAVSSPSKKRSSSVTAVDIAPALIDSLSNTFDGWTTDDLFDHSNFTRISEASSFPNRIPPLSSASQISQLSIPSANVSHSTTHEVDMYTLKKLPNSQPPPLVEFSPRVAEKKNACTNIYSDYQLINVIGNGEDSTVYTAVLVTGELVAVKVIHQASTKSSANEKDHTYYPFTHEAQVLLSLPNHENLIQFYAIFHQREKNEIHIVMELVEAGSLHSLLTKITTPLSLATIRKYTRQLIVGLNHLHLNSVVHCDVKGENVLIGRDGQLKLTDFGQSRRIHFSESDSSEVQDEDLSFQADVWLLGCTIVEMLNRGKDFSLTFDVSESPHFHCMQGKPEINLRQAIHCSCCPCLLFYEKVLRENLSKAEDKIDGNFFPFELPETVDPELSDFLRECFRLRDRPNLEKLIAHPFLEGCSLERELTKAAEIEQLGSPTRSRNGKKDADEHDRIEFSNSLNCSIYDF